MARRFFTQSLQLRRRSPLSEAQRAFSTRPGQLFEIEVSPSTSSSEGESEALMLKKLDDIVHRLIVQRATPDWLPFVPGSSFWVPPRRSPVGVNDFFAGKLADRLSDEESLSVATDRGWPCSHFLIDGSESAETVEVDDDGEGEGEGQGQGQVELVEVNVNVLPASFEDE